VRARLDKPTGRDAWLTLTTVIKRMSGDDIYCEHHSCDTTGQDQMSCTAGAKVRSKELRWIRGVEKQEKPRGDVKYKRRSVQSKRVKLVQRFVGK
jgi:hypothetical protein